MANENKNIGDQQPTFQELLDYRAGKLEGKALYRVEKFLIESELAADAFEGFDDFGNDEELRGVTANLNKQIIEKARNKPKMIVWYRKPVFSIAASLLLLLTVTSVFLWQSNIGETQMAMEKSMPEAEDAIAEEPPTPPTSIAQSDREHREQPTAKQEVNEQKRTLKKEKEQQETKPKSRKFINAPDDANDESIVLDEMIDAEEESEVPIEVQEEITLDFDNAVGAGEATAVNDSLTVTVGKLAADKNKSIVLNKSKRSRTVLQPSHLVQSESTQLKEAKQLFIDGKYLDAAYASDEASSLNILNTDALILSGLAYLKGGEYELAKNKLYAIQSLENSPLPKKGLAKVLKLIEQGKYAAATSQLQKLLPKGFLD